MPVPHGMLVVVEMDVSFGLRDMIRRFRDCLGR